MTSTYKKGDRVLVDVSIEAYWRVRGVKELKATVVEACGADGLCEEDYVVRVDGNDTDEVRSATELRRG